MLQWDYKYQYVKHIWPNDDILSLGKYEDYYLKCNKI